MMHHYFTEHAAADRRRRLRRRYARQTGLRRGLQPSLRDLLD